MSSRRMLRLPALRALAFSLAALAFGGASARAEPGAVVRDAVEIPAGGSRGSPLDAPRVRLTIDASPSAFTWVLRIENTDSIPLRLVGDAHLLSIDVTPPSPARSATVHCTLPPEM